MWSFLLMITLSIPIQPPDNTKGNSWWDGYNKPEVLVTIMLPLLGGVFWLFRDYSHKTSMVERQKFKEELIESLKETLKEAMAEREKLWEVRLLPINHALDSLSAQLRDSCIDDKEIEGVIQQIQAMVNANSVRLSAVESRLETIIDRINKELSSLLSSEGQQAQVRIFQDD